MSIIILAGFFIFLSKNTIEIFTAVGIVLLNIGMATRQTARKRQPPKAWDAQAVPSRGRKRPASTSRGRPAKEATDLATPTPASGTQTPPTNASELSGTLSKISQTMVAMSSMLQ